jgi:hypothetical protein
MDGSQFSQFVEKLKTDADLRQKVIDLEKGVVHDLDTLRRIAADEGFDITAEMGRPQNAQPTPTAGEIENNRCLLTCCIVLTSVL